jgi:hypothetical protein
VLTVGGWVKIIAEMPAGTALPVNAWLSAPVVPQAHLLGAAAGTLVAAAGWILDARRARARTFRNS